LGRRDQTPLSLSEEKSAGKLFWNGPKFLWRKIVQNRTPVLQQQHTN
jgi:hypothetical protein